MFRNSRGTLEQSILFCPSWAVLDHYLPGPDPAPLYPSISPVNSFRAILTSLGLADLPLVPDRSYFSDYETFLNLTEAVADY